MPRIAAAIGVFATIAICIFINVKRYPAVWDMVGSSSWFTQDTNAASQDPSPQPTEITEKETSKKPSPAPQPTPEKPAPVHKPLPSLKPQIVNQSNPSTDLHVESSANKSAADSQDANASQAQASAKPTKQITAYQGLKPSPIRVPDSMHNASGHKESGTERKTLVSDGTDKKWPAEMSPRMKYAAKSPLLETYQQWNPERPVVPVVRPKEKDAKKGDTNPAKSKAKTDPGPGDSSAIKPAKQSDTIAKSENKEVVQHLPAVVPSRRPIHISIQGTYPAKPIQVYPSTGR